jgi:hypothetical protein
MPAAARPDRAAMIAARALDLRAEFEAQLRAVARLEEQLHRSRTGQDDHARHLETVLRHELAEMLHNNTNIRDVLKQLETDTQPPVVPS